MADCVENMFYVSNEQNERFVPWHGLGTAVEEAPSSADALRLAGLDWDVVKHPVQDAATGLIIPNVFSNTRSSDNSSLGIVTDRYKIVQNKDAFDFTDNLLGGDVRYETAGSLKNGRTVWLLAKLPDTEILGDAFEQYLCFANTHDGTGSVKVCCTPIRVVCNNTLNAALSRATRNWSMKHCGNIEGKIAEAHRALELAGNYIDALAVKAEEMAAAHISDDQVNDFIIRLFPIEDDMPDRQKNNIELQKANLIRCYNAEDLANFKNTKWGMLNAVSDLVGHYAPSRLTDSYQENNWLNIMNGHKTLDLATNLLEAM